MGGLSLAHQRCCSASSHCCGTTLTTRQNLQHIWSLPFGAVIGGCLMTAQIAGGIGIQFPRTGRLASVVLCVVYLCFSLATVP